MDRWWIDYCQVDRFVDRLFNRDLTESIREWIEVDRWIDYNLIHTTDSLETVSGYPTKHLFFYIRLIQEVN
jgi:hypothetical protein